MKKIVYIGGGTGSLAVLGGLSKNKNCHLTGVYPVTDDGGSTGKLLKDDKDLLPMGDLRKMIIAVIGDKNWREVLDFRFDKGVLKGHNLGNLLLAGTSQSSDVIKDLFNIEEDLLPVSLRRANLCIRLENNKVVQSETKIDEVTDHDGKLKIIDVWVEPKVRINPEVRKAISQADMIVMGPGDLYTSVGACLVIPGVAKAVRDSKAKKVYVCNLMTKFGQSNNFSVQGHVQVIQKILGGNVLDYVVYNNRKPSKNVLNYYKKHGESLVEYHDNSKLIDTKSTRVQFKNADLLGSIYEKSKSDKLVRSLIRHNPDKLAKTLLSLEA